MSEVSRLTTELSQLGRQSPRGYFAGLHIRFSYALFNFHTYDNTWLEHYTSQAYAMRDPTIAWGFSTTGETRWSDLQSLDPFGIFDDAARFGLVYGVSLSHGPISSRSIVSAARDDREFSDDEISTMRDIVHRLHNLTEPPESLTKAQTDALRLIAEGDRHTAAAAKLNISESALKARLTAARERLLARTTAEAIQRAKEYRLL
ncbi:autoinducer binding domain-containing protein [Alphaproteobacteria bacterium KMM 3653]|uniref:Autoinducer binding domain-containing protein n=1 Tax=Harenicola maris TaxID=2841044 RepID=A0AAP2G6T7_9RHOB|nr:autoinducer binding domain-containing protein [Harenicola maris]